ncbi:hypothetical protein TCON_0804 [Astathelohania contejeani]|uniref:XPG-I domain-containing protein n=1 Tax=Astathelohania contejeani TaxID=164912 RepID=A0ABQ7I0K5_9MICR|nr:hypothetical protein TCON_0804 [Thelohania contejeani]
MPIRGLETFKSFYPNAFPRRPSLILRDASMAIDGFWFIKKYVTLNPLEIFLYGQTREYPELITLLDFVSSHNIDLLWIWSGVRIRKSPPTAGFEDATTAYEEGRDREAMAGWKRSLNPEDHVLPITNILQSRGISVLRAPYSATAQAAYLANIKVCNYIFAPTEFLLFEGGNKLITEFHGIKGSTGTNKITCIDIICKADLMRHLSLDNSSFLGYGILLGCEFCPTMPVYSTNFDIFKILKIARTYGSICNELKLCLETNYRGIDEKLISSYMENFCTALTIIRDHPVMKQNGIVEPLSGKAVPNGFEDIFGPRASNTLYSYLAQLKIFPEMIFRTQNGNSIENILKVYISKINKKDSNLIPVITTPENFVRSYLGINAVNTSKISLINQILLIKYILPFKEQRISKILCLNQEMLGYGEVILDAELLRFLHRLKAVQRDCICMLSLMIDFKEEDLNLSLFNALICKPPFKTADQTCINNNIAFLNDALVCLEANRDTANASEAIDEIKEFIEVLEKITYS